MMYLQIKECFIALGEREIICIYEVGSAASGTGRLDGNPDTWQSSTIRPGLKGAEEKGAKEGERNRGGGGQRVG